MATENSTISFLHVDGNRSFAESVSKSLFKNSNGSVSSINASSLEKAVKLCSVMLFDAVVLDLNLPDSFGLDTLRSIKSLIPKSPLIILTDVDDQPLITKAILEGIQDYVLKKDFSGQLLLDLLRRAIERERFSDKYRGIPSLWRWDDSHLHQILSNINDGILVVTKKNRILYANPSAGKLLSTHVQKLAGNRFPHPLNAGQTAEIELEQPDQNTITIELRTEEMQWDQEPVYLVELHNITRLKRAEDALRESEKRFHALAPAGQNALHKVKIPDQFSGVPMRTAYNNAGCS